MSIEKLIERFCLKAGYWLTQNYRIDGVLGYGLWGMWDHI